MSLNYRISFESMELFGNDGGWKILVKTFLKKCLTKFAARDIIYIEGERKMLLKKGL